MARDVFVLGTIGSGTEILLPGVLEFVEEANTQVDAAPFQQNRYGGYTIPRKFGVSKISLECIHFVDNPANDALDVTFGELKSAIIQKLHKEPQPLWLMDNWYANVVLDNNAFSERERDAYSVRFGISFLCREGRKLFHQETSLETTHGYAQTIISPAVPPIFIEFHTDIGYSYTIQNNYSSGVIKVNAAATGTIRIHLEENRASRGGVYVDSEIEGAFPEFPVNIPFIPSLTGFGTFFLKFRKALLL